MNLNVATNQELQKEKDRLEKLFTEAQKQCIESYKQMMQISEDFEKVQDIINKREGKNNGKQ